MEPVYLDCNATTPCEKQVLDVMNHYLVEDFGNEGSRTHQHGNKSKSSR